MAKSYIVGLVENVEKERKNLKNALKNKKISVDDAMPLGQLVSLVNNINLEEKKSYDEGFVPVYNRDENLPDIDTMFDNDPLRKINGGTYEACVYAIVLVPLTNTFTISANASTGKLNKIILSDGTEYDEVTSSKSVTINESGIYTKTNGERCCLVKLYKTTYNGTAAAGSTTNYSQIETINDMGSTFNSLVGYDYYRFVGSNVAYLADTNIQLNYTNYKFIRLDCDWVAYTIASMPDDARGFSFVCNGRHINSGTYRFGYSGSTTSMLSLDTMKLPEIVYDGTTTVTANITMKKLYIPDSINTITYGSSGKLVFTSLETLHLGNGLTNLSLGTLAHLKNITTSPNMTYIPSLSTCYHLTKQSLLNILNGLADLTGQTAKTLTLGSVNKAKLTSEELAIATNKNWTVS